MDKATEDRVWKEINEMLNKLTDAQLDALQSAIQVELKKKGRGNVTPKHISPKN